MTLAKENRDWILRRAVKWGIPRENDAERLKREAWERERREEKLLDAQVEEVHRLYNLHHGKK